MNTSVRRTKINSIIYERGNSSDAQHRMVDFLHGLQVSTVSKRKIIEQFQSSPLPRTFVRLYTQSSPPLYRIINKALRESDLKTIDDCSYFILRLDMKIVQLSGKQTFVGRNTLYRGQFMKRAELEKWKENVNGLMYFNSFLSTTTDESIARRFISNQQKYGNDEVSILFHIDIASTTGEKQSPYAYIGHLSAIPGEDEYLFARGSVFKIRSIIEPTKDNTWHVSLSLTKQNGEQLDYWKDHILNDIGEYCSLYCLALPTYLSTHFEVVLRIFEAILIRKHTKNDSHSCVVIYNKLGTKTMRWFQQKYGCFNKYFFSMKLTW
jgi:hypothetical protein